MVTVFLCRLTEIRHTFFLPMMMLSDHGLYPIGPGLCTGNSSASVALEYCPAVIMGTLLTVVPLILASALLQRFRRSGPTAGAVK